MSLRRRHPDAGRARAGGTPAAIEIVAIGNELLLGETVNTNAAWLGRRLAAEGILVCRRSVVGDVAADIRTALAEALARTGAVLCTGGLGPTPDDLTRPAVAELFGRELLLDEGLFARLQDRFRRRGIEMTPNNRTQAEVPRGAIVLPNPRGTAPGLCLEDERGFAILLPGIPAEVHALVEHRVVPYLRQRFPRRASPVLHRVLRTTGIAESSLAQRIADVVPALPPLTLAFLPDPTGVDLRLTSWGTLARAEAVRRLDEAEAELRARLAPFVYGREDEDIVDAVAAELTARGLELAVAESCTGGLIAKRLTDRAGASAFLLAGVVSYANEAKEQLLGVPTDTLRRHGAVSEETVRAMVEGVRRSTGADAGIAVTGIAGPDGGTEAKPVGTVWLAAALGDVLLVRRESFPGDRGEVRTRAAQAALALLLRLLRADPGVAASGAPAPPRR